jgi:hypothetical protein
MLSTPRSLGFVLAAILGAMLVPGCRSSGSSEPPVSAVTAARQSNSSQVGPNQVTEAEGRFEALAAVD